MPTRILTKEEKEWKFANELEEFLPPELKIREGNFGYPVIQKTGFWGLFYRVADFTGDKRVNIKQPEWEDKILEAIRKYEQKYDMSIVYTHS